MQEALNLISIYPSVKRLVTSKVAVWLTKSDKRKTNETRTPPPPNWQINIGKRKTQAEVHIPFWAESTENDNWK